LGIAAWRALADDDEWRPQKAGCAWWCGPYQCLDRSAPSGSCMGHPSVAWSPSRI